MINVILKGIMNLIMSLVTIILAPIDLLITQFLPDLSNVLGYVGQMFEYATTFLGYIVDLTGLSKEAISLIILFYTFKLTVPLMVHAIKTAIKWYNAIKP